MPAVQTDSQTAQPSLGAWSMTQAAPSSFVAGNAAFVVISFVHIAGAETFTITVGGTNAVLAISAKNNGAGNKGRNFTEIWYVESMAGGTADWTVAGTVGNLRIYAGVVEIDDALASPLDQVAEVETEATSITVTTGTTVQDDEIVISAVQIDGIYGPANGPYDDFADPTSGYTRVFLHNDSGNVGKGGSMAYKYVTAAGAQEATSVNTDGLLIGAVATFKVESAEGTYTPAQATAAFTGLAPTVLRGLLFDAAVELQRTATTDPQTWTHTPVGIPRGVVVAIVHGTESTDLVSSVTYGGEAMTRVVTATDTATEPGRAYLYFLGTAIPTGNQTVSVDFTSATTTDVHLVSISVLANVDLVVVDSDSISENAANPSVTLQYGGLRSLAFAALYSGVADVTTGVTPNANCTLVHHFDIAAFGSYVLRQTNSGTADFNIGATVATDDVAYVALAVTEVEVSVVATPGVGPLAFTGLVPSLLLASITTPAQAAAAFTGLAPSLFLASITAPAQGQITFTGLAPDVVTPQVVASANAALAFTGLVPSLLLESIAAPGQATAAFVGLAPSLLLANIAVPGQATAAFVGLAPDVVTPQVVASANAALAFTGIAPDLVIDIAALPGVSVLSMEGQTPAVLLDIVVQPSAAVAAFSGHAPEVLLGTVTEPGVVALAFTGLVPGLLLEHLTQPGVAEVVFQGHVPLVVLEGAIQPGVAALAFAGYEPTVINPVITLPAVGSVAFTGLAPTVAVTDNLVAAPAQALIALSGHAPAADVTQHVLTEPGIGSATFSGWAPTLEVSVQHIAEPAQAQVTVSGQALTVVHGLEVVPDAGVMAFAGHAPQLLLDVILQPGTAQAAFTGQAPFANQNATYIALDNAALVFTGLVPTALVAHPVQAAVSTARAARNLAGGPMTRRAPDAGHRQASESTARRGHP